MLRLLFLIAFISTACNRSKYTDLSIEKLTNDKSLYDEYLIKRVNGVHRLKGYTQTDSSFGILAVHGHYPLRWPSKGFEWTEAIKILAKTQQPIWWYRHDWFACPDSTRSRLTIAIDSLTEKNPHLDSLWVIGHSLGGYIVSELAVYWESEFPLTVHAIAAPLKRLNERFKICKTVEKDEYLIKPSIKYFQWRTDHKNDSAFKNMDEDPQDVHIKNGHHILLPPSWKEKRLGHNLSIQFVVDHLVK